MSAATLVMVLAFLIVLLETISAFDEKRKRLWHWAKVVIAVGILVFGIQAQEQQNEFESKLASKNAEIADLAKEITFLSTGGDSFCYLDFFFAVGAPNTPSLAVVHDGKYPLQNVHMVITDWERYKTILPGVPKGRENARPVTAEEVEKLDDLRVLFEIPSLGPPGAIERLRPRWRLPDRDQITYSIQIYTQFQTFYQHLKLRKVNREWSVAYRVHKRGPNDEVIVLRENIPNNFPRDQSGKVNWEYE
jgi:hypothetical protein